MQLLHVARQHPAAGRPCNVHVLPAGSLSDIGELLNQLVPRNDTNILFSATSQGEVRFAPSDRDILIVEAPWEVLAKINAALHEKGRPVAGFLGCGLARMLCDFHPSNGRKRELMFVEGPWEVLDLAMKLVREAGPDPAGFFFCEGWPLPFEMFLAPIPAQTPPENPARHVEPDPPAPTPG